ncbi:MAG: 30S ribosomal protein S12 methylthiotransferase RimO [Clostridia bacterium]|nr:30S ribosomal protein S12 methylthiotransferase RimO [Clostridia bacterium]
MSKNIKYIEGFGEITLDELTKKKISFISLGCDKNRVDLEEMMNSLDNFGFKFGDLDFSNIVIINTCAFILPARKEAIDNILEMVELKKSGKLEKIIVTGCLSQRYIEELQKHMPEVDEFVQLKDNKNICQIIAKTYGIIIEKFKDNEGQLPMSPFHFAYLKISDGCNNNCAYCTIPRIRGRYISKPFNEVISRAKELASKGAKELIIVAQDTTRYGFDLYDKYRLTELLNELSKIEKIKWIRLHYCYPEFVTDELLELMKNNKKICPYIDIPLQHIDEKILKEMNRKSNEQGIKNLITKIKTKYPEIAIRSTFIVGFPGENYWQFLKLCKFIRENKLDNVGFFAYSREEGTKAFFMKSQVPELIKKMRLKKIQTIQEKIADDKNRKLIGQEVEVLIDLFNKETGFYEARSSKMSPNVDYYINVEDDQRILIGEFFTVVLNSYDKYSFTAKLK